MAECVVVRCVQERRFLKRELQKWSKNVLYLVGLERVAEELIGHDKWTKVKPQSHINESETIKEVVDWNPNEECCFCANRRMTESPVGSDHIELQVDEAVDIDSPKLGSVDGSRPTSPSSPDSDQPLDLSLGSKPRPYLHSLFNGEAYGSSLLKVPQVPDKSGKAKRRIEAASNCKRSYTDDELQAALRDIRSGKLGTRRAAVIYGIPRSTLRNKVYKLTLGEGGPASHGSPQDATLLSPEDMLDAGGGFGSSAAHPSPSASSSSASESLRQLLRNRMFEKSAAANQSRLLDGLSPSAMAGLDSAHSSLGPLLLSHMLASIQQQQQGGDDSPANTDDELKLPLLPDLIRKLSGERFEQERHRQRPTASEGGGNAEAANEDAVASSVILKIPSYKPVKTANHNNNNNIHESVPITAATSPTTTITVVSSQSNGNGNSGGGSKASKGIGVTLREIIAKSITQRANSKESKKAVAVGETIPVIVEPLRRILPSTTAAPVPVPVTVLANGTAKRMRVVDSGHHGHRSSSLGPKTTSGTTERRKESKNGGGGSSKGSEKRVRPKRGRYRNYDRDNLVEAVRAVQRGEMSVHRAGSYYGVPHSTLEYKVKERHLLRPRKNRGGGNNNGSAKVEGVGSHKTTTASSKSRSSGGSKRRHSSSSGDDNEDDVVSDSCQNSNGSVSSSTKSHSTQSAAVVSDGARRIHVPSASSSGHHANSAATASSSSSLWQNSPLFAVDFGGRLNSGNFFASQMMRKLQEDALTQGHGGGGGGTEHSLSSRDAVLLGVLIRNGLQATEAGGAAK